MSAPDDSRPNILLLHTDQQRFDTIAALGARHMVTPHTDRLVREGTTFARAYSSAPVCQPARHDLITGVSARHHGYYGNREGPIANYGLATIPRLLTEAGYQTLAVGKMHFWPQRSSHGFSHLYLMEELPNSREDDAYLQFLHANGYGNIRCQHGVRPLFYHTPQISRVPDEFHGSAWVATKTIELLETPRHRPFFLFASWVGPHPPYYVPKDHLDEYRGAQVPRPCEPTVSSRRQVPVSPENADPDGPRMRAIQESYYAAITFIDKQIGRILDALDSLGLRQNTIVIFTTDHGEMLGDMGAYQKQVPYEGSAHIPLIVSGPGFAPGARSAVPVTTWDTAATIARIGRVEVPADHPMIGTSLQDLAYSGKDRIAMYHLGPGRSRFVSAVTERYKFIHWYNGGQEELYDLADDPWEQKNCIKELPDLALTLGRQCVQFEAKHGQPGRIEDNSFVDLEYAEPHQHVASLYPLWSSFQFPPWPELLSGSDLDLIAGEMQSCLANEFAYICKQGEWREHAMQEWEKIGGNRQVYRDLFAAVDRR